MNNSVHTGEHQAVSPSSFLGISPVGGNDGVEYGSGILDGVIELLSVSQ